MDAENNRTRGTVSFSESIVIKASPEDAFAYLGDPATAERIDPAIISYVPDTVPMAVGTINTVRGREERPDPQFRDTQLKISRRRRQRPVMVPVAIVRPAISPFMPVGTNLGSQLGFDQVLECLFQQAPKQLFCAVITETCKHISER